MVLLEDIIEILNKERKSRKKMEEVMQQMSEDMESIKNIVGLFLDQQAGTKKYVSPKSEKEVSKEPYFSIKIVPEDDRPPYWDYDVDGNGNTLWKLVQSKDGRSVIQKIIDSTLDDDKVIKTKKRIDAFKPVAIKLVKKMREEHKRK